jgi:hypothetical protein
MKSIWKTIQKAIGSICIVDRFLILFMLVLFVSVIFHLFPGDSVTENTNTIDIITRTSAAAIFGYLISSNFGKSNSPSSSKNATNPRIDLPSTPSQVTPVNYFQNQIGFPTPAPLSNDLLQNPPVVENSTEDTSISCNKLQVVIVSVIGLISFIILMVIRQLDATTPEMNAIVSQLRDFVSACTGFLISCKKTVSGS